MASLIELTYKADEKRCPGPRKGGEDYLEQQRRPFG